jgi:hypothetical protein
MPEMRKPHLSTVAMDAMEENGASRKTRAPASGQKIMKTMLFCRRRPQSWHRFCLRCPGLKHQVRHRR